MYFLRSIDATIASNGNSILFIYTKLPGLIINTHITPNNMEGWDNTLICKNGTITLPQFCEVPGYGEFLNSRIEISKSYKKNINSGQVSKINESIVKNIDKLESSKSYKAAVADLNLKRREK